jgi:hypothetical protein
MRTFYRFVSYLSYPGFIAVLGILHFAPGYLSLTLSLLGYAILPLLFARWMIHTGRVDSLEMKTAPERNLAYRVSLVLDFALALYFQWRWQSEAAQWPWVIFGVILLLTLVNQFGYKASMHTAACGGLLAFSFTWVLNHFGAEALVASPPMQLYLGSLTLLFALVYLSRYRLGAHSHRELLSGTAIGLFVTFAFQLIWNL